MKIIGAGMAGLLAAGMLRNDATLVVDRQADLPNNHSAVLRFRSPIVGDSLNIPFRKVRVLKGIEPWKNPVADAVAYSLKTNGTGTLRSITSAYQGEVSERYIAPRYLIGRMYQASSCDFLFNFSVDEEWLRNSFEAEIPVISTMPMNQLMKLTGWEPISEFRSVPGYNIIVNLDESIDMYCSLYVPSPKYPCYRVSITGNQLIAEHSGEFPADGGDGLIESLAYSAATLVGVSLDKIIDITCVEQPYAKIAPIDEDERRRFILYATEQYGIYSLGRFATWRPGLLLDDVVNDVKVIQRLIRGESNYDHIKRTGE